MSKPSTDAACSEASAFPPQWDKSLLPLLELLGELKHVARTGWLRTVEHPESVAGHTFGVAILAMCAPVSSTFSFQLSMLLKLEQKGLDINRCIFLALCHDMAESVVGDIPTYASVTKGWYTSLN